MRERRPFTCSQCRRKVVEVYFAPCCGAEVCPRCIVLGHEMEWRMGDYKCKKCRKARRGEMTCEDCEWYEFITDDDDRECGAYCHWNDYPIESLEICKEFERKEEAK